eukprot:5191344-Alexandrium_andersonii.AAC.1
MRELGGRAGAADVEAEVGDRLLAIFLGSAGGHRGLQVGGLPKHACQDAPERHAVVGRAHDSLGDADLEDVPFVPARTDR